MGHLTDNLAPSYERTSESAKNSIPMAFYVILSTFRFSYFFVIMFLLPAKRRIGFDNIY